MVAVPSCSEELIELIRKSGLVDDSSFFQWVDENRNQFKDHPKDFLDQAIEAGFITEFHARHFIVGKYRGFILGKYRILNRLGIGGMGYVYLAEHSSLKRKAAIKVLPSNRQKDPEAVKRFYREARASAVLDHPNIVKAFDINHEGNIHFLAMEYVEGTSLDSVVEKRGSIPHVEATKWVIQIASGLQHGHDKGIVHRDIKPSNLLLDTSGNIKILDMGLALFFQEEDNLTKNHAEGMILGTADYMAPEQIMNSHGVDYRADIYSLGATYYSFLTGKAPFSQNSTNQKLLAHQFCQPVAVHIVDPKIPEELSNLIQKMMAKNPNERFQSMKAVITALTPWSKPPCLHDSTKKISITKNIQKRKTIHQKKKQSKRLPYAITLVGIVLVILAILFIW